MESAADRSWVDRPIALALLLLAAAAIVVVASPASTANGGSPRVSDLIREAQVDAVCHALR